LNKSEFINSLAEKTQQKRSEIEKTINAFWSVITETIANNDTVNFVGMGSFGTKQRKERTGQNPKTGEKLVIPAATLPYFKAGNKLKEAVAKNKE
jgi:DNA-binding protein HU-beta